MVEKVGAVLLRVEVLAVVVVVELRLLSIPAEAADLPLPSDKEAALQSLYLLANRLVAAYLEGEPGTRYTGISA